MRARLLILFFTLISIGACGQTLSFGSALVYGDEIDVLGVNVRGYFNTADHRICFGPEFTFFNKSDIENQHDVDISLFEFNFNGHYVFEVTETFGINPIIGLNYSKEEEIIDLPAENEVLIKDGWGLLTGVGFHWFLTDHLFAIGEIDHLFSPLSENTFTLGLLYTIPLKKQAHHEGGGH